MVNEALLEKNIHMRDNYKINNFPKNVTGQQFFMNIKGEERYALHYPSKHREKGPVYIDIHGGGFLWGYPEEDDLLNGYINEKLDIEVYSIDYPLSSEEMYPRTVEYIYETLLFMQDHCDELGFDKNKMIIGGHSAGGNLAAAICLLANKRKDIKFLCQVLDYPVVDMTEKGMHPSVFEGDNLLTPELMKMFTDCYCSPEKRGEIYCSPLCATDEDLYGLPPAIIQTCGDDSLNASGEEYALKLIQSGVPVMAWRVKNVPHAFNVFEGPDMIKGQESLASAMKYFLQVL